MTAFVQDPEGLAKHFSDIYQLTDVLVLRTGPALLKLSQTQWYITIVFDQNTMKVLMLCVSIGVSFGIY